MHELFARSKQQTQTHCGQITNAHQSKPWGCCLCPGHRRIAWRWLPSLQPSEGGERGTRTTPHRRGRTRNLQHVQHGGDVQRLNVHPHDGGPRHGASCIGGAYNHTGAVARCGQGEHDARKHRSRQCLRQRHGVLRQLCDGGTHTFSAQKLQHNGIQTTATNQHETKLKASLRRPLPCTQSLTPKTTAATWRGRRSTRTS